MSASITYGTLKLLGGAVDPGGRRPSLEEQVQKALANPVQFVETILKIEGIIRASQQQMVPENNFRAWEKTRCWKTSFCGKFLSSKNECSRIECRLAHSIEVVLAVHRIKSSDYKQKTCTNKKCECDLYRGDAPYSFISYEKCRDLHNGDLQVDYERKTVSRVKVEGQPDIPVRDQSPIAIDVAEFALRGE